MFDTFAGLATTHMLALVAGFLLGALVFLGDPARPRSPAFPTCTDAAARWCPLHGRCTCATGSDDSDCPLHGTDSTHGTT
ncbi:hypothetical protein KZZ52_19140 [Dactylosporangium sp. AC04546]|uniref:hypothetical protein n=1 Tax=Dactylosporangium sp. AC04546 TaxID=2862460 RepID=UPI001EE12935|nr:hypothetical protein [Dactylosporangium sp. AC04546]WVK87418.1 hypothetical protein KZZ52_19140 [Dactylosporangium sp. AC04546]